MNNTWTKKYGLYVGIGLLAVLIIAAIVILGGRSRRRAETTAMTEAISGCIIVNNTGDESFTYDFSAGGLKKDEVPEIQTLAEKYLEAIRVGDVDTLNKIMQSDSKVTEENVNKTGDYIEAYQDVTCYTMKGLEENTYVVYVVYDAKLIGIETPAPSMIRLYVCRDSADSDFYIYNGVLTGERKTYIDMADAGEDVSILRSQVNQAFQDACEKDEQLAEVYSMLQNHSVNSSAADDTESEPESESVTGTETETEQAADTAAETESAEFASTEE